MLRLYDPYIRHFHEHTKLAIMALMPTLYSHMYSFLYYLDLKVRLHVPSPSQSPSPSPSNFNIVSIETDRLTGKMGTEPIPSVKRSVSIHTMLKI